MIPCPHMRSEVFQPVVFVRILILIFARVHNSHVATPPTYTSHFTHFTHRNQHVSLSTLVGDHQTHLDTLVLARSHVWNKPFCMMDRSWDIAAAAASGSSSHASRKRPHSQDHKHTKKLVRELSNPSTPLPPTFIAPIYMPLPKCKKIGSICAGMLSEHWALLGEDFEHTFVVEKCPLAKRFILDNAEVHAYHDDVSNDTLLKNVPSHDVLTAGFPCQSFSYAGHRKGSQDKRGHIYKYVLEAVQRSQPRVVLLENVVGLMTDHPEVAMDIVESLQSMVDSETGGPCYKVFLKTLNSQDFLPQRRERVFFVAIKLCGRPFASINMRWPTPTTPVPLASIWDTGSVKLQSYKRYPLPKQRTARAAVEKMLKLVHEWSVTDNVTPKTYPIIVDAGSSKLNYGLNVSPCLTRSRCNARMYWSLMHGRVLSVAELGRLQGFDVSAMRVRITEPQLGSLIGNAFSKPVWHAVYKAAIAASEGT